MKQYDKYKDSGIAWIGKLPEHWETRILSQVATEYFISNKEIKHQNLLSLSYGRIINKDIMTTEGLLPASYDTYQVIREGNIVLRLTDLQNDKRSLRVGLCTQEGIITSAYLALFPRKGILSPYLYQLLHTADIKKVFYGMGSGLRQNLNWQELRKLVLPLPPLSEQEAIVAYLEEKTSEMDALVTKKEELIVHLRELKQSTIAKAVTQGLDATASLVPSGIPWLGDIPKHWEVKRMRHFIELFSDKGHPNETLLSVVRDQGVIIRDVESKDENHNYIPSDLSGYKRVEAGDFVINKMKAWQGSYAVSEYQGIVSPAYYTCKLNFPNKQFFNLAVRSKAYVPFFAQCSKGIRVGQWDLEPTSLKEIPFFLPPKEEQEAIVAYIEQKTDEIDRLIECTEQEIARIRELKQSLIADAVTGCFKVPTLK